MSGTLRKNEKKAALNVNAMKMEFNKEPATLSFATPRPSNFANAVTKKNWKGIETMKRATNAQVATTWKKKKGAFCTAKSKGGKRKSKRKTRKRKTKVGRKSRKKRGGRRKKKRRKTKRRKR